MRDSIRRFCSLVSVLLFAGAAAAQSLPEPQSSTVHVRDAHTAAQQLAGRGIELPGGFTSAPAFDSAGNEIVWREQRRSTDPLGNVHVFYRQHLGDVELFGSEVGLHFSPNGAFLYAGGEQFEIVTVTNSLKFNRLEAVRRGSDRLRTFRGESPEARRAAVDELVAHRAGQTTLRLVQVNGEFRFAYFTFAEDASGRYHGVVIDAEDDRLIGTGEANPGGNCSPQNRNISVNAVGIPVRSGVPNRVLKASPTTERPAPFTHEGFYLTESTLRPSQAVFQETSNPAFRCNTTVIYTHSLFPLRTDANGVPTYGNFADTGVWEGKVAGDALYHTFQTMRAFQTMQRNGWDGSGADAKIVIESTFVPADQARFIEFQTDPRTPLNTVVLGKASMFYNPAAALDLIAHEWGHGVILDQVSMPYTNGTSQQREIHEGYADVIGHIVEKRRQPAGTGLEQSSDWTISEDTAVSGYDRGAVDDGELGHDWVGPNGSRTMDHKVHENDNSGMATPHSEGNVLSMVLRLLTEGGRNPICLRAPGDWSGCVDNPNTPNVNERVTVTALGFDKASRIMFQALYEMPSTVGWNNIATYVAEAAFNLYGSCTYNGYDAFTEQKAVSDAFAAVGHPRATIKTCAP
jgi:hypothetical protein